MKSGALSVDLWIPFIWITINASRPVVYWLSSGTIAAASADAADGNAVDRNIYLALMFCGMIALSTRKHVPWERVFTECGWILTLYAYYLLSVLWSDHTFIAFKRWIRDAGDIVMVLLVLTHDRPIHGIRTLFIRLAYLLIPLSVLYIKWYPEIGRYTARWTYETMYSGVTTNKNSLGLLGMICGLILLGQLVDVYRSQGRRLSIALVWGDVIVLGMCIWILTIAGSATALGCFLLGTAAIFLSRLEAFKSRTNILATGLVLLVAALATFTVSESVRGLFASLLGRDVTLTERTVIWEKSLELKTNFLFGSGFSSTWLTENAASFADEFNLPHSHNGYLETYLHTGIIGVFFLAAVLVKAWKNASKLIREPSGFGHLTIALFIVIIVYNYTEVAFCRSNILGFLTLFLAAAGIMTIIQGNTCDTAEFHEESFEIPIASKNPIS